MNVANQIISEVLQYGGIDKYLGLPDNPLFVGLDKNAWHWIKKHHANHGVTPALELFRENFPEVTYKLVSDGRYDGTTNELLEEANRKIDVYSLADTLNKAISFHDSGNLDQAAEVMRSYTASRDERATGDELFPVLTRSGLKGLPKPEPLIHGVLDASTIVVLEGQHRSYKSFLALDWACCLATGKSWYGHTTEQSKVLYIAAEGGSGLDPRITAWEQSNNRIVHDDYFHSIPRAVQLGSTADVNWLAQLIKKNEYDLVIVDTQSRSTAGVDENSAKEMGVVLENVYKLKNSLDDSRTTVLLVHHIGKNAMNGSRGSTVIPYGSDGIYRLVRDEKTRNVVLTCEKYKDGPDDLKMNLTAVDVADSLVLEEYEPALVKEFNLKQAISEYCAEHQETTVGEIRSCVTGDNVAISKAVNEMIDQGFLSRVARKLVFVKAWTPPF